MPRPSHSRFYHPNSIIAGTALGFIFIGYRRNLEWLVSVVPLYVMRFLIIGRPSEALAATEQNWLRCASPGLQDERPMFSSMFTLPQTQTF
jgi:hypothetical protein